MLQPALKTAAEKFASSHNGKPLDQKAMLKANPMISKVLVARYLAMPPEQQQALTQIFTSQNADVLEALLPEVKGLIKKEAGNGATVG